MSEKENRTKNGTKNTDVIARSLKISSEFCYWNAIKYAERISRVDKLKPFKKWFYRILLHKGGEKDLEKIHDYLNRMEAIYPHAFDVCVNKCCRILKDIYPNERY